MGIPSIHDSAECDHLLASKPLVMLKFSAEWCGPCKAVKPAVDHMSTTFPNVAMADVDVDENQQIASQFGVTAMPTFLFFHRGVEIDRVKGGNVIAVTAALRKLSALAPKFGGDSGHRLGGTPPVQKDSKKKIKLTTPRPGVVGDISHYVKLYFSTLFTTNARGVASSLN